MGIFSLALTQDVEIQSEISHDRYGDISYGPKRTIKCRIEVNGERIRDASGVVVDKKDVLYSEEVIQTSDRVTLPTGDKVVPSSVEFSQAIGVNGPLYKAVL